MFGKIENPISDRNIDIFSILMGGYVAAVVIAGLHGAKLVQIGGLSFDAGLITYSLTFLLTDIVTEAYGKKYSLEMVVAGICGIILAFLTTQLSFALPASPDWEIASSYDDILGAGSRVLFAVIATMIISQSADIYVYAWIKKKTGEKMLWLRNNISTICGGLLDAIVFSTIAFYGIYPVGEIIISAFIVRIIISLLDTPFVYLGVYILHKIDPALHGDKTK